MKSLSDRRQKQNGRLIYGCHSPRRPQSQFSPRPPIVAVENRCGLNIFEAWQDAIDVIAASDLKAQPRFSLRSVS